MKQFLLVNVYIKILCIPINLENREFHTITVEKFAFSSLFCHLLPLRLSCKVTNYFFLYKTNLVLIENIKFFQQCIVFLQYFYSLSLLKNALWNKNSVTCAYFLAARRLPLKPKNCAADEKLSLFAY